MKLLYEIFLSIFCLKKCNKDHFSHDYVYETKEKETMVGTGDYIEGKEIERKEFSSIRTKYCTRCREHSMEGLFGGWWPLILPKVLEGEKLEVIEKVDKSGFIMKITRDEVEQGIAETKTETK